MKFFYCIVLSILFMVMVRAEEYVHAMRIGGTEYTVTTRIFHDGNTGNKQVEKSDPVTGAVHRILLDEHGGTVSWSIEENGNEVLFTRNGVRITVNDPNRIDGEPELIEIDETPWFADMQEGLQKFAGTGNDEMEFWTVNPESYKAYLMAAKRAKIETISVQGVEERAVRIRVTVSRVPSVFFSMKFWFRESDSVFLKYEGKAGGPGSADVTTELIQKEK